MRIGVAIASRRRPDDIANILNLLGRQTLPPHRVVLSVTGPADLPALLPANAAEVVTGTAGLCAQRNRALDALCPDCDVILFYDDDFIPSRRALEGVRHLFNTYPGIAGATGLVLQDGVTKGGITLGEALKIVAKYDAAEDEPVRIMEISATYGCNMAFRTADVAGLRFDERLPLYGWQEDVDFSARVHKVGSIVHTNAFAGVHRGVTGGRSPGQALGYSQIVNPAYLMAKGTMTPKHALTLMTRNLIVNHLKALHPEPHIDRAGRAAGNWFGLLDVLLRKGQPERILKF